MVPIEYSRAEWANHNERVFTPCILEESHSQTYTDNVQFKEFRSQNTVLLMVKHNALRAKMVKHNALRA